MIILSVVYVNIVDGPLLGPTGLRFSVDETGSVLTLTEIKVIRIKHELWEP